MNKSSSAEEVKFLEDSLECLTLHTNDTLNVADDQGKVLINLEHPSEEPDIFLDTDLTKMIKSYQIGGIRFLYDKIVRDFNSPDRGGCVLAHDMGLGKTLQIVCFCKIFLKCTDSKTVICIVPVNTTEHWIKEFEKWLYFGEVGRGPNDIKIFVLNDLIKTLSARSKVVTEWSEKGGVLLLGYELFRRIVHKGNKSKKREEDIQMLNTIQDSLLNADLAVCDEGHRIKNMDTETATALKRIRTSRRIVLSGYPLQNNVMEYFCMVDFVRPNYLGSKAEFTEIFHKPIQNGNCTNATAENVKLMKYRSYVLHSLLLHIVQRRSNVVLKSLLPPISDFVILLKMTSLQKELYQSYVADILQRNTFINAISGFAVASKIFSHPDIILSHLMDVNYSWATDSMKGYVPNLVGNSPKMEVFINLLSETVKQEDRMLVFSQSIETLDLMETFLKTTHENNFEWKKNWNYFRMDGSCPQRDRDRMISEFNVNPNILLFLLSTKACSHGINLVGANRVIIFDSTWNPCNEQQALARIYRHGQKKPCFVYRLILDNCIDKKIYDRQINKQSIADRVVDESNPDPTISLEEMKRLCWGIKDDDSDERTEMILNEEYEDIVLRETTAKLYELISKPPFLQATMLSDNELSKLSTDEKIVAFEDFRSLKASQ